MSTEYFYGATRRSPAKPAGGATRPNDSRGASTTGRIVNIMIGQGHGFIRLRDDREVFFHRADLHEGTAFNDLRIGDAVSFELLEDLVSGARALRVVRQRRSR